MLHGISIFVIVILTLFQNTYAQSTQESNVLPAPVDISGSPSGIESPGGNQLPAIEGKSESSAPAISAISEITYPNETLVITGMNLDGAHLKVWAEGKIIDIQPLRTAENRMQAVVPEDMPVSTMLVWPVKNGKAGSPARVNGASAWWCWPGKAKTGIDKSIRIFGKNLSIEGIEPVVYIQNGEGGSAQRLAVESKDSYHINAILPGDVQSGKYYLLVHNGTGGKYGWSDPIQFEAVQQRPIPERIFNVDDYKPPAGREDASAAIQAAIDDAAKAGGGIVQFGARSYLIYRTLILPEGAPIVLRGAGMGVWDPKVYEYQGGGTLLTDWLKGYYNKFQDSVFIDMRGEGSRVENMTMIIACDIARGSKGIGVYMRGNDQTVAQTRIAAYRDYVNLIECNYQGDANQEILSSELYMSWKCVYVQPGTRFVRIADCTLRGHFAAGRGTWADGIEFRGGRNFIVENNNFAGEDKAHGKIMSRSVLLYDNSMRNCYLANNHSEYMGAHRSVPGIDYNIGEQYLFHSRDPFAGVVRIVHASHNTVTVEPNDLSVKRNLPVGSDLDGAWIVFVSRGKGVGQWRIIESATPVGVMTLTKPWRVVPDKSSQAVVQRMFRHNIVYNNYMDPSPTDDVYDPKVKNTGIYLYHNSFDNVVANNVMKNIGEGVSLASSFDTPCAWNVIRENKMENVKGSSGGTSAKPMFFNSHMRSAPADEQYPRHWYTCGNVCRSNTGDTADIAGAVGWLRLIADDVYKADPESGQMMLVVENNSFNRAKRGFVICTPSNWLLLRNNSITVTTPDAKPIETVDEKDVLDTMTVENKQ